MTRTMDINNTRFDSIKWAVVILLLASGLAANYYFVNTMFTLRLLAWLILLAAVAGVGYQTAQGQRLWKFLAEARIELYKVIWPTREETLQTTLVVLAIVIITALFLWGVDTVLLWVIGKITGSGVG